MAAISSVTTSLPSSTSDHRHTDSWGYPACDAENTMNDPFASADSPPPRDTSVKSTSASSPSPQGGLASATPKTNSADNFPAVRGSKTSDSQDLSPPLSTEPRPGRASPAEWTLLDRQHPNDAVQRMQQKPSTYDGDENSKWIHRDKLARIESEELKAAGIFVPLPRASSKQRRDRSQSRLRRGVGDAAEPAIQSRSRKNSSTTEHHAPETMVPSWDLRTPEEIAEEEANAYFTSNGLKGGSRIPVAKTSPAPIQLDVLSVTSRRLPDSPEDDSVLQSAKTRARSTSAGTKGAELPDPSGTMAAAKRAAPETSPKKNAAGPRKSSAPAKAPSRPKTRSSPSKDSTGNGGSRPPTRSAKIPTKELEGEPPWMINSYKPDPRLPPDEQLLPTVARRLVQEQWEREGKFGDAYDTALRPLNNNALPEPAHAEKSADGEHAKQDLRQLAEWPLKVEAASHPAKSPTARQGSYSTMPKISDSPRTAAQATFANQQPAQQETAAPSAPEEKDTKEKGGCGCCVVM